MKVIAVLPEGLEKEGANELIELGAKSVKVLLRSVSFEVDLKGLYRIHLNARLPFRFLREIAKFSCQCPESLYKRVQESCDWKKWLNPSQTFCVDVSGHNLGLPHSHYTALTVKNAIIDLQRKIWGHRSSVSLNEPEVSIHLHLSNDGASISFASSRRSLHRRGYRPAMGLAPLKENIAAGLIRMINWDSSMPLIDPLCGSGTLLIEAVNIALKFPIGLNKSYLFELWPDFDQQLWKIEQDRAIQAIDKTKKFPKIIGCEENKEIALQAKNNIAAAGLQDVIEIKNIHFNELFLPSQTGIIVCNPPYGKRIGTYEELCDLYQELGSFLKSRASGWHFWLLSGTPKLGRFLQMKAIKRFPISNGGIDCRWMHYPIN